jgi:carboxypeptidase Q
LPLIKFYFKQSCQTLPDAKSYNVIGEITGSENPNKFITVGGHLDSWDLAEGAHDDGTGVMQSAEVLRIFKATGYRPKNSIRAVFFMNEENGHKGGLNMPNLPRQIKKNILPLLKQTKAALPRVASAFQGASASFLKEH